MILKTFWMSVWWLVHAIRNPSAHLPHILLRHHLQLLVLTSSTMKLVHFTNGKLFIFLVDIFFLKRDVDQRIFRILWTKQIWSDHHISGSISSFFFSNEIQNAASHSYLFFKMLFKKLFSRSLSYGCILVSLTLPGHDQNDVVDMKKNPPMIK